MPGTLHLWQDAAWSPRAPAGYRTRVTEENTETRGPRPSTFSASPPDYDDVLAENARLRRLLAEAGVQAGEARLSHSRDMAASQARTVSAQDEATALRGAAVETARLTGVVARSEALRRAILESATDVAIISMDREGVISTWNEGAARIMGWAEAEVLGQSGHLIFTPEDVALLVPEHEMRQARDTGRGDDERFHLRKDGTRFWATGLMMPLRDESGSDIGFVKILRDRTGEHNAQQALEASEAQLRAERNTLEAIFEAAPVGMSLAAASGASILINAEMQRIVGGADLRGTDVQRYQRAGAVHPDGTPYAVDDYPTVRALQAGEAVRTQAIEYARADGSRLRGEISTSPIRDPDGQVFAVITTVVDVEQRERAIEHQHLLMGELAHRMKNTLSVVQAIVSQTLRSSASLGDARTEIMERLAVLSRAQDALTRKNWMAASLADTVDAALAPLGLGPDRLAVDGPEVTIGSRAALSFTLALHELGTNAVKYGALSDPTGRVEVRWTATDDGQLDFTWNESGGPRVQPPTRKGFGTRLIDTVSRTFSGHSTLNYDPAGVCWKVSAGLEALQVF